MAKFGLVTGLVIGVVLGITGSVFGPTLFGHLFGAHKPYAGQQERRISSLSEEDVAALERGEGWGLAKPAELNGYPGPAHVLEFADKLALTDAQKEEVETAFANMRAKAVDLGKALVEAEAALDNAFKSSSITEADMHQKLAAAEQIRAALRSVHLAAHLEITPVLSDEQKQKYAMLRGYGSGHEGHSGH